MKTHLPNQVVVSVPDLTHAANELAASVGAERPPPPKQADSRGMRRQIDGRLRAAQSAPATDWLVDLIARAHTTSPILAMSSFLNGPRV